MRETEPRRLKPASAAFLHVTKLLTVAKRPPDIAFRHVERSRLAADKISSASSACLQTALGRFRQRSNTAQNCETVAKKFSLPRSRPQEGRRQFSLPICRSQWPSGSDTVWFFSIWTRGETCFQGQPKVASSALPPTWRPDGQHAFRSQFAGQNGNRAHKP